MWLRWEAGFEMYGQTRRTVKQNPASIELQSWRALLMYQVQLFRQKDILTVSSVGESKDYTLSTR